MFCSRVCLTSSSLLVLYYLFIFVYVSKNRHSKIFVLLPSLFLPEQACINSITCLDEVLRWSFVSRNGNSICPQSKQTSVEEIKNNKSCFAPPLYISFYSNLIKSTPIFNIGKREYVTEYHIYFRIAENW